MCLFINELFTFYGIYSFCRHNIEHNLNCVSAAARFLLSLPLHSIHNVKIPWKSQVKNYHLYTFIKSMRIYWPHWQLLQCRS